MIFLESNFSYDPPKKFLVSKKYNDCLYTNRTEIVYQKNSIVCLKYVYTFSPIVSCNYFSSAILSYSKTFIILQFIFFTCVSWYKIKKNQELKIVK